MLNQASVYGLTDHDVVLPLAPMFHANAWGLPYAAPMTGANLVLSGPHSADPAAVVDLIETERVTVAAGVPTVWNVLLDHLGGHPADLSSLRALVTGGALLAPSLVEAFDRRHGIPIIQGWGMTETSPLGTFSRLPAELETLTGPARYRALAKQGRPVPGIRLRVADWVTNEEVPSDGTTVGELQAKGPWVAAGYYGQAESESFVNGWLRTGDVATADEYGVIEIVDRTKDMIKSGGEWISSLEIETALMTHPAVSEAAVIGVHDDRWGERPAAWVSLVKDAEVTEDALLDHLRSRFPNWWLPDEIRVVQLIPRTSVGKFDKRAIRATYESNHGGA
jgi:fatty-acyl-CoA synthase